jgi:hypothetical protein
VGTLIHLGGTPATGLMQIVDNGPATPGLEPDFITDHLTAPSTTPPDCAAAGPAPTEAGAYHGDYVVTDAAALPTAKDQCKRGAWRDFGGRFKNQGQCVAFVQRGPKP